MCKVPEILEDQRQIEAIATKEYYFPIVGYEPLGYVGEGNTRIVAYGESGLVSAIPWFAVYKGDDIVARVPAGMCQAVWYVG